MPSPFPGMDPYLEPPEFFPGLHDSWISYLRETLQLQLPPVYYVDIRARVWIEYTNRIIDPDVEALRTDQPSGGLPANGSLEGAVAVSLPPVAVALEAEEQSETYLEIRTVQGDNTLVTAIEVLSPSNKTSGAHGRAEYLRKQKELLDSRVNLVEIDLLRGGLPTTAMLRRKAVEAGGPFDYHVCVRKMDEPQQLLVYPIRLAQRLPEVAIPLLPGDAGVTINLQAVFDRCYDAGPYRRVNLYRDRIPELALTATQAAWAAQLLRDQGLLPTA